MKKLWLILSLAIFLTACSILPIRKMDVEQGNVITDENISQLHTGMSKTAVEHAMGTPLLMNTFNDNRVDYVYTYQPGYGKFEEKYVTLIFSRGVLQKIEKGKI